MDKASEAKEMATDSVAKVKEKKCSADCKKACCSDEAKMSEKMFKEMIMNILETADSDIAKQYDEETAELRCEREASEQASECRMADAVRIPL